MTGKKAYDGKTRTKKGTQKGKKKKKKKKKFKEDDRWGQFEETRGRWMNRGRRRTNKT